MKTTITTDTAGIVLMLDLLVAHVIQCDKTRADIHDSKKRSIATRAIELDMLTVWKEVCNIVSALEALDADVVVKGRTLVENTWEDLVIGDDMRPWWTPFKEMHKISARVGLLPVNV